MFSDTDLASHLVEKFEVRIAILYGSAATGRMSPESDLDVACFVDASERYPAAYLWQGLMVDAWVYPLAEVKSVESFLRLHDGRVLVEENGAGRQLLAEVTALLARPPVASESEKQHLKVWLWKMLGRASKQGALADHRRHWVLSELPEAWCKLTNRHYLGASDALRQMEAATPETYNALERALKPDAPLVDITAAITKIAGPDGA